MNSKLIVFITPKAHMVTCSGQVNKGLFARLVERLQGRAKFIGRIQLTQKHFISREFTLLNVFYITQLPSKFMFKKSLGVPFLVLIGSFIGIVLTTALINTTFIALKET